MNDHDRRTPAPTPGAAPGHEPVNFTDWAHARIPHLSEVSNSNPHGSLRRHNLVAITGDTQTARAIALDFERSMADDTEMSMLVLGHAERREDKHQADPEGVTTHAAKRSLIGGIPGAVVVALIIGVGVWLVTNSAAATIGAAIGGAIFGFYVSAVWSYVIGTGQSEAFQQGFVDPDAADAILVAFHADDPAAVDEVRRSVGHSDDVRLYDVDARGELRNRRTA